MVEALYPKDWWDPRWVEVSSQAAEISHELYHQSIFDVVELNSTDIPRFRFSCA
jgi:hypothetical protein